MGVVELNIMQGPYTDLLNILGYSTDDAFDDDEDYINACFLAVYDRLIIVVGGESENRRLFLWKHQ